MKKYIWIGLIGCGMMSACASTQGYDDYLETWIGRSEADLVANWGAPLQMKNLDGDQQMFIYVRQKTVENVGANPQNVNFGNYELYNPTNNAMESETLYYCQTIFITKNDIIIDYMWSGDDCVK